ncbi:MAG: cytochrome c [Planctomycetaceae bacterium]|nr:cytochrome c [Planctomycetaceae bacterium]
MKTSLFVSAAFLLLLPCQADEETATGNDDLAKEAGLILRRNCARCHKGKGSESGYAFNVMDIESLTEEGMVVAEDHENSSVWEAMYSGRMPPRNRPQLPKPSPEDVDKIKEWIQAGAPPIPPAVRRPRATLKDQLLAMRSHLQSLRREDRRNIRYFTMSHLHNDLTIDDEQLKTTRLALSKAVNSLSWEALLVKPKAVDEKQVVYAVDIDKLGWGREHWLTLTQAYPYALSYGAVDDDELDEIDEDIQDLRGSDRTPVAVRADWLVAVATKPPLYYSLLYDLKLPDLVARRADNRDPANPKRMTDLDLEIYLGVDAAANIRLGKVVRCGFTESGVSGQNRLIERHNMKSGGFYWKSYDFLSANRRAILSEFPLGPETPNNEFNDLAFEHDGGEIIFNLPNGMQGYLLIDGKGNRIDAGPIEVVADSLRTSGNEQIFAGVSCIACHRNGMIEAPNDEVRKFSGAVADARDQVRRLYPEDDEFREWVSRDTQLFQRALVEATSPFVGEDDITDLPEPVGEVARRYHLESMTLETVAAELFVAPKRLRAAIDTDPRLKSMGLRILLRDGGGIKRGAWESGATSMFQLVARQFGFDPK